MPYQPIVPEGQHLGTSHLVDGAVTGHLFEDGTNDLKGHAAWRWVDDPEEDYSPSHEYEASRELTPEERETAEIIAALILLGTARAVVAATPHVKHWWKETAVPPMRSAWKRIVGLRKANIQASAATSSSVTRVTFVASATAIEVAEAESKIGMRSTEWELRFRAMLAAGAFKEEQWRILSNARIEDGDALPDKKSTTEQLTSKQFADRIKLMLETNPSLLDEETSDELIRVFSARSRQSNDPGMTRLVQ
ncbi:hypothetical protein [Arthrobacter monumenti]